VLVRGREPEVLDCGREGHLPPGPLPTREGENGNGNRGGRARAGLAALGTAPPTAKATTALTPGLTHCCAVGTRARVPGPLRKATTTAPSPPAPSHRERGKRQRQRQPTRAGCPSHAISWDGRVRRCGRARAGLAALGTAPPTAKATTALTPGLTHWRARAGLAALGTAPPTAKATTALTPGLTHSFGVGTRHRERGERQRLPSPPASPTPSEWVPATERGGNGNGCPHPRPHPLLRSGYPGPSARLRERHPHPRPLSHRERGERQPQQRREGAGHEIEKTSSGWKG